MSSLNKIWTISDFGSSASGRVSDSPSVRPAAVAASSDYTSAQPKPGSTAQQPFAFKCCHIPTLPNAHQAESLLHRVVREFQPILTRRNYNVLSISELCCCNDGLDFDPTASGGKRRKRRIMSNNIWGYNQTSFGRGRGKSHTIHVRLRQPSDHARFLPYEDVAGTLAHELSHCEHSDHNDKFYKLMDEILDEHAGLMASQLRMGGAPMAAFTGTGNALGSFTGTGNKLGGGIGNAAANNPRNIVGQKLGGDPTFTAWMTPAEAAVAAAEARRRQQQLRLRGDHCCRPCTIDISDGSEDEETDEQSKVTNADRPVAAGSKAIKRRGTAAPVDDKRKRLTDENLENAKPFKTNSTEPAAIAVCIDLTVDEDNDRKPAATAAVAAARPTLHKEWACRQCTFRNRPLALACDMCATERICHRVAE
jgi:DNA-dependent metalloprotease WSS1